MSGEFTLVELSKIETDTLRKSVIDTLLMESNIMTVIPWETIGALATTIVRMGTLPSVGFRKINEGYAVGTAALEQKVENISLMGAYFDTDKAIARAKNTIASARAITQVMMTKAIAYKFNDKFINGNPESDPEEFKGMKERVNDIYDEGYTGQKVASVNVSTGANTGFLYNDTAGHEFLTNLDKAIYQVKGHNPDFMFMNSKSLLAIRALLRRLRLLDNTKDMFDRIVDTYQGVKMVDIGVKADQSTEVILNTETAAGVATGDDLTSIYLVKFGIGEFVWGLQEYPLEVTDKGELEDKPIYRTEMDWPLGLANADPYSIVRMHGVTPNTDAS